MWKRFWLRNKKEPPLSSISEPAPRLNLGGTQLPNFGQAEPSNEDAVGKPILVGKVMMTVNDEAGPHLRREIINETKPMLVGTGRFVSEQNIRFFLRQSLHRGGKN